MVARIGKLLITTSAATLTRRRLCSCAAARASSSSSNESQFSTSAPKQNSPVLSRRRMSSSAASFLASPRPDTRQWREQLRREGKSVGLVPTMGALHQGHIDLVRASLSENDTTIVSIFVNPAQFAPTEDLSSYPRTLPSDVESLHSLSKSQGVGAIFAPTVSEMYPSGLTQDVSRQVGAFVELSGLSHQMEGGSRPTFFRGVATVVTKLFHIVEPTRAYFGQKDIQQAIIIRRLVSDLLFPAPIGANSVRVLPTTRAQDGLALSSRNAYLSSSARNVAPILNRALRRGVETWEAHSSSPDRVTLTLDAARMSVTDHVEEAAKQGVRLQLDYIALNHPSTLADLEKTQVDAAELQAGAILSGAALVSDLRPEAGKEARVTRLIDNVLLGFQL